jgi:hypothetical protein
MAAALKGILKPTALQWHAPSMPATAVAHAALLVAGDAARRGESPAAVAAAGMDLASVTASDEPGDVHRVTASSPVAVPPAPAAAAAASMHGGALLSPLPVVQPSASVCMHSCRNKASCGHECCAGALRRSLALAAAASAASPFKPRLPAPPTAGPGAPGLGGAHQQQARSSPLGSRLALAGGGVSEGLEETTSFTPMKRRLDDALASSGGGAADETRAGSAAPAATLSAGGSAEGGVPSFKRVARGGASPTPPPPTGRMATSATAAAATAAAAAAGAPMDIDSLLCSFDDAFEPTASSSSAHGGGHGHSCADC